VEGYLEIPSKFTVHRNELFMGGYEVMKLPVEVPDFPLVPLVPRSQDPNTGLRIQFGRQGEHKQVAAALSLSLLALPLLSSSLLLSCLFDTLDY
jgi:hypothetical protein